MTVKKTKSDRYAIHVKARGPDGKVIQVRRVLPKGTSKKAAVRIESETRHAILHGLHVDAKPGPASKAAPAPTLESWVEVFVREHSAAKGLRPGTIREQRRTFARSLIPALGASTRIDAIGTREFLRVRSMLAGRGLAPKTINNVLGVLSRAVRFYYERAGLEVPHFDSSRAKVSKSPPKFWEPDRYAAMVEAAAELGPRTLAIVLLMGDCGLRTGEVVALEWSHLQWEPTPQIVVQRSYTDGHWGPPKNGRPRTVPMTTRTAAALRAVPQTLRVPWVLTRVVEGAPTFVTRSAISWMVCKVERAIGEETSYSDGQLHKLRHTYVTRLAAAGAPARVIMELAGHRTIGTTLRYMHLLPGATAVAVSQLESFDATSATPADQYRINAGDLDSNSGT
jgi:integrase